VEVQQGQHLSVQFPAEACIVVRDESE
jgi:hypothetical protein